jgi:hypothetical protein
VHGAHQCTKWMKISLDGNSTTNSLVDEPTHCQCWVPPWSRYLTYVTLL